MVFLRIYAREIATKLRIYSQSAKAAPCEFDVAVCCGAVGRGVCSFSVGYMRRRVCFYSVEGGILSLGKFEHLEICRPLLGRFSMVRGDVFKV